MSAVACTAVEYLAGAGVDVHPIICKLVAFSGGIGALVSTAAGVFAPVFLMPKPTGPYRTGKTTRLWIDGTRRSWLLRSKGRSLGKIPESRMLMANVWYPAAAPKPQLRRDAAVKKKKETSADDGYESGSDGGCDSGDDLGKHWPDDEAAKVHYEAMAQEKLIMAQALGSPDGKRIGDRTGAGPGVSNRITIANARKAEARRRRRRQRGKRTHWLEPTLATTMAVSFALPGWIVDYFRLVRMEARVDVPVADPPAPASSLDGATEGFPLVLFSHSFTGMKEQNSSLLQELASWGHIVVAVDHPHDAALVLYPDGTTADFRGYDMPMESEPRNWWRFRHEHARWRALDLAHALERIVDANGDASSPLYKKVDLTRVAAVGHSFGGAACLMLAQMDPRITSVVLMDPWMWPLGKETTETGAPCPLLVLEAPEFLWDRDIFCVNNGEMSSALCAATAPQCAGVRPVYGPGSEPPTPSKTPMRRVSDGSVDFDELVGPGGEVQKKTRREIDADPARRPQRHPDRVNSGGSSTNSALERARARDAATTATTNTNTNTIQPGFDPATAGEDPRHTNAPPGFMGASVDGFRGVGFYTEDGFYHAGSPPVSPTSVRKGVFKRPQHPRSSSQDNLAAMGGGGGESLGSFGSFGSQKSASKSSLLSRADGNSGSFGGGGSDPAGIEPGTGGSGDLAHHRSGSSSGWTEILDAVNPPTEGDAEGEISEQRLGRRGRTDSWESLLAPFRGQRRGGLNRTRASSFNSTTSAGSIGFTREPSGVAFKAVVDAAMHFDFTDMAMVAPVTTTMLGWVGRGGRDVHDISSAAVLRFLRTFNHAREPDAAAPDSRDLERLRAGLLSRTPVSEVLPAREWGFTGGHAFGYHGRIPADDYVRAPPKPPSPASNDEIETRKGGPLSPLSKLKMPLKMPPLPIPDRLRRIRLPPRPPGSSDPMSSAERTRRARLLRQYRKSFDATHVPENWMELESIASDSDGETPDADDEDDGYVSGDELTATPVRRGNEEDETSFDEFMTPGPEGANVGVDSPVGGGGFVTAESSPADGSGASPISRFPIDDAGGERGGAGHAGRTSGGEIEEVHRPGTPPGGDSCPPGSLLPPRGAIGATRTHDASTDDSRNRLPVTHRQPVPRRASGVPYPVEVKPRGVRWVKSYEWDLPKDREWSESQRREMRWLLHEATDRGVRLQPSDFVAMFPSFDSAAIQKAAVEELMTLHEHPAPKPLVWMSQMIIDESGELRSKHDRPH
tara:strand:+ start:1937 stop:5680 length:3744 start_codon:yes stop_codon:yes gene_type:complete